MIYYIAIGSYPHLYAARYDYNLKIFYFCDIKPLTNSLQCYKYVAESKIVSLSCNKMQRSRMN